MRFSLLLQRRPTSLNKPNPLYRAALTNEATRSMNGRPLLQGRLYTRIIWFHADPTTQDVDNIVKPILDSLKTIVFADDSQIGECSATRIDLSRPYRLIGEPDTEIAARLSFWLASREKHILLIEVGEAQQQSVIFESEQEEL